MNSILKLAVLFGVICGLASCDVFKEPDSCSEDIDFVGIKFSDYYRNDYMRFNPIIGDRGYFNGRYKDSIPYSEEFSFSETGDFSHLKIVYQDDKNDTIVKLNGKFKVDKDKDYPWRVLKLNADSIYEKQAINDTINDSIYFSSDFTASKFSELSDKFIYNHTNLVYMDTLRVWEVDSNCFKLNTREFSDSNLCDDGYYLNQSRTFCLKQPEEIENEQNLTGDEL